MDSRMKTLLGASALLVVLVAVVLVSRGGDDDAATGKPEVEIPADDPPTELLVEDLEEGDGPEAAAGDQIGVSYVGVLYDTGAEFDSNFDSGLPFEFQLGGGSVIPGWDEGLEGMKVGGRRQLTIPPDLAYGAQGQPPDIPPNSTLVFVIDLLSVN